MAKNAGHTVQALLANAPAPPRTQVPSARTVEPGPVPGDVAANAEPDTKTAPPTTTDTVVSAATSRQRKPSTSAAEPSAPPTLRLSQPTAETLRSAWLAAKRDRVLLTYQDFAGEVITAGLQHRAQ